jgi:hypothetical protein
MSREREEGRTKKERREKERRTRRECERRISRGLRGGKSRRK